MVRPAPIARMTYANTWRPEFRSETRHESLNGDVRLDVQAVYANPFEA